jgi:predicted transposase YbfD/YdcC
MNIQRSTFNVQFKDGFQLENYFRWRSSAYAIQACSRIKREHQNEKKSTLDVGR